MSNVYQVFLTDRLTGKASRYGRTIAVTGRDEVDRRFLRTNLSRIAVVQYEDGKQVGAYFVNRTSTEVRLLSGVEVWPDLADWVPVREVFQD